MGHDQFSTIVDVNVSSMLLNVADSTIVGADTVTATAMAFGNIGREPQIVILPRAAGQGQDDRSDEYLAARHDPGSLTDPN